VKIQKAPINTDTTHRSCSAIKSVHSVSRNNLTHVKIISIYSNQRSENQILYYILSFHSTG